MPGLRSPSPASSSPNLRRIRTSLSTPSSTISAARARVLTRAKAPDKAKLEEEGKKQIKNSKEDDARRRPSSSVRGRTPPLVGPELEKTRCSWITANSEPLCIAFHDEEWGVPVHDDQKLFEMLTLSQALAELTWPAILNKREEFREMFDGFNYVSVAEFTEKKISLLRSSGSMLLSEQKIRAIVANAKQMQKVIAEFGSFSNYCWSFVNHRPIRNSFRYARQVPIKMPKSEAISKDLMRRGFQCVGPTTIYSFMQVIGIVNDHLSSCFRYQVCSPQKVDDQNVRSKPGMVDRTSSLSSSDYSETRRV